MFSRQVPIWICITFICFLTLCVAPSVVPAQQTSIPKFCDVINCDCENVGGGILERSYRRECQQCEARLRETCRDHGPPFWKAIEKSGVCENKCSVVGENAYPRAASPKPKPPASKSRGGAPPSTLGDEYATLHPCPPSMEEGTQTIDGVEFNGCLLEDGRRHGMWIYVDKDGKKVIEILYIEGSEVSRTESALP